MRISLITACAAICLALSANQAQAQIRITEWMYDGSNGEYVEITNLGGSSVNMNGWSFDDDSNSPGSFSLSILGTLAAYETAIITEATASNFRTAWGLSPSVKIAGSNANNLGRNDQINIFNGAQLVDRLTFGDQNIPGSIRTQNKSGNPNSILTLGTDNVLDWSLSSLSDSFGSYASTGGQIGNPGNYAVPEPASVALLAVGGLGLLMIRKRLLRAGRSR